MTDHTQEQPAGAPRAMFLTLEQADKLWWAHDCKSKDAFIARLREYGITVGPSPDERTPDTAPAPLFEQIRDVVCKHADHGEFAHPNGSRFGCIDDIMLALDEIEKQMAATPSDPPPVSAQELREIAKPYEWHANVLSDEDAEKLRKLADWLERHHV